ncbi:MAG: PorV/PorQ family protein [Candidatus Zixiibacteriota bacterium]
MKPRIVLSMAVLLALCISTAFAGNADRIGSAGAQELRIPYGSRGTAMGGAVVANTSGIESMFWNPAGLATLEGTEAMFSYLPYIADIDQNFVGIATHIEDFGTIGAGVKIMSIGDIEETTQEAPDGTGRIFSPSLAVINLTYARILTANVSFGATAMFINEQIHEVRASGLAFDVGFLYNPGWHGVRLGLAMKNYGAEMQFQGRGFEVPLEPRRPGSANAASFDLPASINIGMAYDFIDNGDNLATLTGNFAANTYSNDVIQGGFEYGYKGLYFIRGGYNYSQQDEWIHGATLGGGLTLEMGETRMTFEYAWNETEFFDDNQFFSVSIGF